MLRGAFSVVAPAFAVCTVLLLTPPRIAQAQEGTVQKLECSLRLVPADATFYAASLRNREQVEAVLRSKAWTQLMALPAVQDLLKKAHEELGKADSPFAQVLAWYQQPENKQLLELLLDLGSHEVFCYGGDSFPGFLELAMEMQGGMRFAPLFARLQAQGNIDPQLLQFAVILNVLAENLDRIRAPELVIGFKLTKPDAVASQLQRLEKLLAGLLEQTPLKGRLKRTKVDGADLLVLELDGSLVPWDRVPFKDLEEKPGQFDKLQEKLRNLKVTVSLGMHKGYVLLTVGESTRHLARFGNGKSLAGVKEFQPLAKYADRKLTNLSYSSAKLRSATGTKPEDLDSLVELVDFLPQDQVPEKLRTRLKKDLEGLAKDLKAYLTPPGAAMSFSFLNGRGQESFSYDWTGKPDAATARPLALLNHVGGSPIAAVFGQCGCDGKGYETFAKYVRLAHGYFEEFGVPQLEPDARDAYEKFMKEARPLLKRLDEATAKMVIPALAEGQFAFVLDAKWKSKAWVQMLPTDQEMPMLELGLVLTVKDAELLKQGMREYREVINGLLDAGRGAAPPGQFPPISLPEPQTKKSPTGTLYFYELPPDVPVDRRLMPTAGLSEKVLALSLSQEHADRLLTSTPLQNPGGPLANTSRPLLGAAVLNWPALVDAAAPWVQFGLGRALEEMELAQRNAILEQVRTGLEVLRCFRGFSSVTYVEGDATVTHFEMIIQDLK
jgi:hypothetical protein